MSQTEPTPRVVSDNEPARPAKVEIGRPSVGPEDEVAQQIRHLMGLYGREATRLAIHEAGHVVADRLFDGRVVMVTIDPNDENKGVVYKRLPLSATTLRGAREDLIDRAAGGAAVRHMRDLLNDQSLDEGTAVDNADMLGTARALVGHLAPFRQVEAEMEQARQRADRLASTHWPLIVRVAESLLQFTDMLKEIEPYVPFGDDQPRKVTL